MLSRRPLIAAALASLAALICSCTTKLPTGPALPLYQAYDRPAKLPQNPDNVRVKVSLSKQRTYVMEGGDVLLVMPVSVGAPETPTPTGNFRITSKVRDKRDQRHGYAHSGGKVKRTLLSNKPAGWSFTGTPMPYWCGFKEPHGFHTGWLKHHPCTNGSIRMHENLAPKFYRLVKVGTPVNIAYSQPEDATHGNIPLPPDAGPLPDYPAAMYLGDGYFRQHREPSFD